MDNSCEFETLPRPAGWFHADYLRISLAATRKPRWLTRMMVKLLFEFEWRDS